MSAYSFSDEKGMKYYSHKFNIGGYEFEFIVIIPVAMHNDILSIASMFIQEMNNVNQLTHYSTGTLEIISRREKNNPWYSQKDWTTISYLYNINAGGYYYSGFSDVEINSSVGFENGINGLNHELGHKIDDKLYEGIGVTLGTSDDSWRNLVFDNIEKIEKARDPNFIHNGNKNDDGHIGECMAEVNTCIQRYFSKFKLVAPELYEAYTKLINPTNDGFGGTRTLMANGKSVKKDNEEDRLIYLNGFVYNNN